MRPNKAEGRVNTRKKQALYMKKRLAKPGKNLEAMMEDGLF